MTEIEKAMLEVATLISREGGCPNDIWHPDFGWVMRNGVPTETSVAFLKLMDSENDSERA